MNIKINHIAKMEGHAGFMASVLDGDVRSAKLEVQEGIRLIEGVLIGREYLDMPLIAQRICGICPIVHNLTSVKALENAVGVTVSEETEKLRTLFEHAQFIHSHALHLFFLSLADFLDMDSDIELIDQYPKEAQMAMRIREYGMAIVKTIGGRVVHPLTNTVGGFKKVPEKDALREIFQSSEEILQVALELGEFFKQIKIPDFWRETEYVSLGKNGTYAIYDGDIISNRGLHIPVEKFEVDFKELQKQNEVIKRVEHAGKSYMVGAIARVNNNRAKLKEKARKYLDELGFRFPDYNPFHNILFQMVEVIHSIEESRRTILELMNLDLERALAKEHVIHEGKGVAAVEAPRGTLYYHVDVDQRGYVRDVNIITPTAQFMSNLEEDIAAYIPQILALKGRDREKKMRAFIRAYDPCISCAVH